MSESAPTRVFVVAPTPLERSGLRSMLADAGTQTDVLVVGEADALVETGSWLSEADVVVVAGDALVEEAARIVAEEGTQAILLLSDEGVVSRLRDLPLSGWGIVPPDAAPEELAAAIAAAAQGLIVLPKPLIGRLLQAPATVEELSEPLTAREHEVLGLLGEGLSNKQISRELRISEHTVKFHLSSLYTKLGVSNRAEAISRGARQGLISL